MLPDAQNVTDIAVVTGFVAEFAILPLNCPAASEGETTELTFMAGGKLGGCR